MTSYPYISSRPIPNQRSGRCTKTNQLQVRRGGARSSLQNIACISHVSSRNLAKNLGHKTTLVSLHKQERSLWPKMKGILIFDDRSDLAFFSLDREMRRYVVDRIRTLDMEAGSTVSVLATCILYIVAISLQAEELPKRDVRDCLSAFCLPLFTSFVSPHIRTHTRTCTPTPTFNLHTPPTLAHPIIRFVHPTPTLVHPNTCIPHPYFTLTPLPHLHTTHFL